MQIEDKIIGDCTYHFRQASFMEAKTEAFKLTALLKGCFGGEQNSFDIGQFLSNLNSQEMAAIESFICKFATVDDEQRNTILLQNKKEAEAFFNDHRDHYFQFIFEGIKFHFLGFLPAGVVSKVNTLDLAAVTDLVT